MDPVLQRLGDVTIQRLERPREPQRNADLSKEPYGAPEEESVDEFAVPNVKRALPQSELGMKRPKLGEKPDESAHNMNPSETDMSDFDSDSELDESDGEASTEGLDPPPVKPQQLGKEQTDEEVNSDTSFFEKFVEQVEPPNVNTPKPLTTPPNAEEDYDKDIKQKLKEMGEISFETVKKGEKAKKTEASVENEVVVTPARKFGADGEELTNLPKGIALRRNIREVMDETKLDESTLAAQRQEAERLRRVQEQQRLLRELQRQAAQERMQHKVMAMLQGNQIPKPGTSSQQTRIGNTVLVKLPNGQTKPMTRVLKRPFELVKVPKAAATTPPPSSPMIVPPKGRNVLQKRPVNELTPSVSIAPVGRKMGPMMPPHHFHHRQSDSDSEGEEMRSMLSPPMGQRPKMGKPPVQTIDISSDDDCIVVSEPEGEEEDEPEDDPTNSGMHTNDEFNQPDEQGRVLVNVGHPENEPDIFVAPQVSRIIKPHQIGGVRFLYDNVVESINRFDSSSGFGCILAHSMGLGKTLQLVTFSDIFLRHTPAKTILCIMPINTLQNWMAEFNMWLPTEEAAAASPLHAHGRGVRPRNFNLHVLNDSHKTLVARANVVHEWRTKGGVLLIGYEQFRLLSLKKFPRSRKKPEVAEDDKTRTMFDGIHSALVRPGPDLVICDEGHRIKNSHSSISQALKQMETKRRVVLTGYPLQNNLMEYWCMVDFVRPNYLGTKTEFCNMFERPIMNGQCIDSTEADIKLMRYRAHVLHSLLLGFVQRRSHAVLQTTLPQKEEHVLLVRMTPFQRTLYETFMNEVVRIQAVPNPLKAFAVCCKIWNHPDVLYNFLKKRAGGEAVDIDLEEVGGVPISKSSVLTPERPKKAPAKPRKTPAKGKNGKPAASVTPYNSSTDPNQSVSNVPPPPLTSFGNAISQGKDVNSFGQPESGFHDISQTFPSTISQPYYDHEFDQNAQFPTSFPNSTPNYSYPNTPSSNYTPEQNQQVHNDFLNLDNQQGSLNNLNNSNQNSGNFANLPSGISLTPLSSKKEVNPTPIPVSQNNPLTPLSTATSTALASLHSDSFMDMPNPSSSQTDPVYNGQFPESYNQSNYHHHHHQDYHQNYHWQSENSNFNPEQNNFFGPPNNQFNPNTLSANSNQPWFKKEEKQALTNLISPKNENSSESKPKINILSDIKLPPAFTPTTPEKKIKILSDIKIEIKKEIKEELEDDVKMEFPMPKQELIKQEVKMEDEGKEMKVPLNDNPFAKMSALSLRDSKEDSGIPYDWAIELLKDYTPGIIENSAKMKILFCIINESITLGDRLLVFSQSLIALDLIEQFLQMTQIPGDTVNWAKNVSYYRLDGSTSALEREKLINEFNSNPKIHLFLVSTRAGSLGINLVGANRVVVLDASWNPCHDTQAVCRVYRYGQRKPCFVYRLVVDNCLEKKIYDRQINKQGMSDRVVDECNPDAHLTMKDVSTLCWDDKSDEGEEKDWSHVRDNYIDVVLQKVLEKHSRTLNKEPFQHESLLVDRKEKQLSQQEKRLAKKGYEREKQAARQPTYNMMGSARGHRPVASVRPMQQGERPSRWIPAEHWQRQGMTAQEMTLPLDVVIPTNQPEKGNIVLKAGQKVLVLKSPKGVYMQLESGKIVAIKTAIKVKGKSDDNEARMVKPPHLPTSIKTNPSLSVIPQKRPGPIKAVMPGAQKLPGMIPNINQNVPKLVTRVKSVHRKPPPVDKPGKGIPISSEAARSMVKEKEEEEGIKHDNPDEIQKIISMTKKNISIQRVPSQNKMPVQRPIEEREESSSGSSALEQLEHTASSVMNEDTPFQDTLDSITSAYQATNDENLESYEDDMSETSDAKNPEHSEASDQSDEVTYVSDQSPSGTQFHPPNNSNQPTSGGADQQKEPQEFNNYNNYYSYNMPPYPAPPPAQYAYPPQPPPHYDILTGAYPPPQPQQPQYNYGYQGYVPPPPQPHYPPPQSYDYNAPPPAQPIYPAYHQPYPPPPPGQYAPPPQGMYPPPPAPPNPAPPYTDYQQYNPPPPAAPYYPNS